MMYPIRTFQRNNCVVFTCTFFFRNKIQKIQIVTHSSKILLKVQFVILTWLFRNEEK